MPARERRHCPRGPSSSPPTPGRPAAERLARSRTRRLNQPDGTRLALAGRRGTSRAPSLLDLPGYTLVLRLDSWRPESALFPNFLTAMVAAMTLALATGAGAAGPRYAPAPACRAPPCEASPFARPWRIRWSPACARPGEPTPPMSARRFLRHGRDPAPHLVAGEGLGAALPNTGTGAGPPEAQALRLARFCRRAKELRVPVHAQGRDTLPGHGLRRRRLIDAQGRQTGWMAPSSTSACGVSVEEAPRAPLAGPCRPPRDWPLRREMASLLATS